MLHKYKLCPCSTSLLLASNNICLCFQKSSDMLNKILCYSLDYHMESACYVCTRWHRMVVLYGVVITSFKALIHSVVKVRFLRNQYIDTLLKIFLPTISTYVHTKAHVFPGMIYQIFVYVSSHTVIQFSACLH